VAISVIWGETGAYLEDLNQCHKPLVGQQLTSFSGFEV
jgi:hypothetical protein